MSMRQCHTCGGRILEGQIHRRQMCTAVTYTRRWDQWRATYRHEHYALVSLCPACDAAEEHRVQREQQRVRTIAAGLVGMSLCLLLHMPVWWSIGFLITVGLLGILLPVVLSGVVLQGIVWSGYGPPLLSHALLHLWIGLAVALALWTLIARFRSVYRARQQTRAEAQSALERPFLTIGKVDSSQLSLPPPLPHLGFPNKEK